MANMFSNPFDPLHNLQRALESSMSSDWFGVGTSSRGAFPPINVFQDEDGYLVVAELPGVGRDNIDVQVHKNQLRLVGKKARDYGEGVSIHRRERESGQFDRTLTIPVEIDADGIKAEYRNGVLAVHVPPAASEKPRSVQVQ